MTQQIRQVVNMMKTESFRAIGRESESMVAHDRAGQGGHVTKTDILEEIKKLPPEDVLMIVEAALRGLREDFTPSRQALREKERKHRLATAAEALYGDYAIDTELTSFTVLDAEDFRA
jgi:hypothetical protein